jgi:anti-sigma factor RsiW
MIDPGDRETLDDVLTRYALGELDGEEARELARLFAERPELRVEAGRLQRTVGLLPYAEVLTPPPDLRGRILAAAERVEAAPALGSSTRVRRRPPRAVTVARVVGSIAALLIAVLAWDSYRLRQELGLQQDVATTLQQPNVVRQFALAGNGMSLAVGTAVLDLDAKRAAVVIRGLPKLPAGQVYRLWARVGDGTVPCGQFNADEHGAVVSQFTIPVDAYTSPVRQLFLNVEPAEQGPQPVGRTVMTST